MTTQELIDLVFQMLGEDGAGFYTNTKVLRALQTSYRKMRQVVADNDPDGIHIGTEADASYPATTRWYAFSGAGRWTSLGRPVKIHRVLAVTSASANEMGEPIPIVSPREEYSYAKRYSGLYLVDDGDNIGLRNGGAAPSSATVLRIRFTAPAQTLTVGGVNPSFLPDFYDCIASDAAVRLAIAEDKPIGDLAAQADQDMAALSAYLSKPRETSLMPEMSYTEDNEDMYDYGR